MNTGFLNISTASTSIKVPRLSAIILVISSILILPNNKNETADCARPTGALDAFVPPSAPWLPALPWPPAVRSVHVHKYELE